MDLAGHFQIVAVDGVVPAFDVDAAADSRHAQDADDVGPVGVAEAGRAVLDVLLAAADAVLPDDVPRDGRVLAVDVEDLLHPLAELRQRVDQAYHLMARLPLQAERFAGHLVEHHLPGGGAWAMFQRQSCHQPPMSQFSNAIRTPLASARWRALPTLS